MSLKSLTTSLQADESTKQANKPSSQYPSVAEYESYLLASPEDLTPEQMKAALLADLTWRRPERKEADRPARRQGGKR